MCNNTQDKAGIYHREDPVKFLEVEVTFPPFVLQCSTVSKYSLLSFSSCYKNILFSCFSQQRPVFDPRTICVRFIVEQDRHYTYNLTSRHLLTTTVAVERSITYSECVFKALGIQHALHERYIVICGLSGCKIYFTLSPKRHSFRKKVLLKIKVVF
jgi:hypothetical protein